MKLLAIHSNKLFFGKAPNFYKWLAEKRGVEDKLKPLEEEYKQNRQKGPLLLKETYRISVSGLLYKELEEYCEEYCNIFLDEKTANKLRKLTKKMKIFIFGSYPQELYFCLQKRKIANNVFGVKCIIDNNEITDLAEIRLANLEAVKDKMKKIGLADKFSLYPDRYGMLGMLIDKIIEIPEVDLLVLGKGITAVPMHKIAGKVINSLEEI